jgi:tetratricopeptide (TPR) repeat protein
LYIAELKQAIQRNPDATWAHHRLASLHEQNGDYEAAVSEEKKFIASMYAKGSTEDSASARRGQGKLVRIHFRHRQYDKAVEEQAWLIESNDELGYGRSVLRLADIYLAQRRYDQAMAQVEKYIEVNPEDTLMRYSYLADVYSLQGRYDRAATEVQRILARGADGIENDFQERQRREHIAKHNNLRYFLALHRAGREVEAEIHITDFGKQVPATDMVGVLARFYAGEVSEDAVQPRSPLQRLIADYYLGMAHLLGLASFPVDTTRARSHFEACTAEMKPPFAEWFFQESEFKYATWELQALDKR